MNMYDMLLACSPCTHIHTHTRMQTHAFTPTHPHSYREVQSEGDRAKEGVGQTEAEI